MKKLIVLVIVCLMSIAVNAQDVAFPYVTYHEPTNSMIFVHDDEILNFLSMRSTDKILGWNTDGRYFGSIIRDPENDGKITLILTGLDTAEYFPLVTDIPINTSNPIYLGEDSVIFSDRTDDLLISEDEQGIGVIRFALYEWKFKEDESAVTPVGSIPFGLGCGGGGIRNTIDRVYGAEVGGDTSGEYNRQVFVPTPYGIVHSNSCTAIRTLLTDPETLESIELGDNLRWAVVSPDGNWVTGAMGNQLILINLETLEITEITTADAPIYSVTWSDDSESFYYVARTTNGELLPINDPDGVLDEYDPIMTVQNPRPQDALQWESTIYHYNLTTAKSVEIYRANAYAIGRMTAIDDTLIFSQIETPLVWMQASIANPPNLDASLIPVTLWQLDTTTGDSVQMADDLRGILVQP